MKIIFKKLIYERAKPIIDPMLPKNQLVNNQDLLTFKTNLAKLICEDKVREVIEALVSYFSQNCDKKGLNLIVMQADALNQIKTQCISGLISNDDYDMKRSRVISNILTIIHEMT